MNKHKLRQSDIGCLLKKGRTFRTKTLTFKYASSNISLSRLAVCVGKKTMPLAVSRNYFKRIQRIHFKDHMANMSQFDIVVIANKSLYNSNLNNLYQQSAHAWVQFQNSLKS